MGRRSDCRVVAPNLPEGGLGVDAVLVFERLHRVLVCRSRVLAVTHRRGGVVSTAGRSGQHQQDWREHGGPRDPVPGSRGRTAHSYPTPRARTSNLIRRAVHAGPRDSELVRCYCRLRAEPRAVKNDAPRASISRRAGPAGGNRAKSQVIAGERRRGRPHARCLREPRGSAGPGGRAQPTAPRNSAGCRAHDLPRQRAVRAGRFARPSSSSGPWRVSSAVRRWPATTSLAWPLRVATRWRGAQTACRAVVAAPGATLRLLRVSRRAFLAWNRSARAFSELEAAAEQDATAYEVLLALGDAHALRAEADAALRVVYQQAAQAHARSRAISAWVACSAQPRSQSGFGHRTSHSGSLGTGLARRPLRARS